MSFRRSEKHTLAVIVHTISIVKKIAKDGHTLMLFGVKKQKSTLVAYDIANIVRHKKNNA